MGADEGIVAKSRLTTRVKEFARAVGLQALDRPRIADRERELGIRPDEWYGSHHPEFVEETKKLVRRELSRDDVLNRLVRFIGSEFWFEDNYIRLKKLCTGLNTLSRQWVEEVSTDRTTAYKWLLAESFVLLTICLLHIAHDVYGMVEYEASSATRVRMASGTTSYGDLERIARRVNDYVQTILTDAHGPAGALSAPNFMPEAPRYTNGIVELVMRLRSNSLIAVQLPRFQDLVLYEYGLRGKSTESVLLDRLGFSGVNMLEKQTANIAKFVERYFGISSARIREVLPQIDTDDPKNTDHAEAARTAPIGIAGQQEQTTSERNPTIVPSSSDPTQAAPNEESQSVTLPGTAKNECEEP